MKGLIKRVLREFNERGDTNDILITQFINEEISVKEFEYGLRREFNSLNEGILDIGKKIVDWIIGKLKSLFDMALKAGKKVLDAIKSILSVITKFREEHPTLFRVIIIFIIVLLILVATASSAHAATTGGDPTHTKLILDGAMGLLDNMQNQIPGDNMSKHEMFLQAKVYIQDYVTVK